MTRETITSPAQLVAWRKARGLSQVKAASIFRRSRRMLQYMEAGKHIAGGVLPPDMDDFAQLYEMKNTKKKTRRRLD